MTEKKTTKVEANDFSVLLHLGSVLCGVLWGFLV